MGIGTLLRTGRFREQQSDRPREYIWGRRDRTPMVVGYESGPTTLGQMRELVEAASAAGAPDDASIRFKAGINGDFVKPHYCHVLWSEDIGEVGELLVEGARGD